AWPARWRGPAPSVLVRHRTLRSTATAPATTGALSVQGRQEVSRLPAGASTAPLGTHPGQRPLGRLYRQRRPARGTPFARPYGGYVRWRASIRGENSPRAAPGYAGKPSE